MRLTPAQAAALAPGAADIHWDRMADLARSVPVEGTNDPRIADMLADAATLIHADRHKGTHGMKALVAISPHAKAADHRKRLAPSLTLQCPEDDCGCRFTLHTHVENYVGWTCPRCRRSVRKP